MEMDNILIDGLEYVNWNRDLFEKAHAGGITAIHTTLVYWEDTHESFEKMNYWDDLIQSNRGPLVLEVNSSPGLEGIEKASGVDVADKIIEYLEDEHSNRDKSKPIDI